MTMIDHIQYAANWGRGNNIDFLTKMMSIYMDHHSYWIEEAGLC